MDGDQSRHARSPSSSSSVKRLTPPRRRSPSERWNEPDADTCDPLSTPRRRSPSERWNETDPDTCDRRAPLLMLLHTHRQPRAALKLPSQDDKGRAAMVGDRRGHVTSMFSIPLRACCTPRCDVDACRRRDDARGTRCGTPGGRSPTPTATVVRMRANRSRPPVRRHLVRG